MEFITRVITGAAMSVFKVMSVTDLNKNQIAGVHF